MSSSSTACRSNKVHLSGICMVVDDVMPVEMQNEIPRCRQRGTSVEQMLTNRDGLQSFPDFHSSQWARVALFWKLLPWPHSTITLFHMRLLSWCTCLHMKCDYWQFLPNRAFTKSLNNALQPFRTGAYTYHCLSVGGPFNLSASLKASLR